MNYILVQVHGELLSAPALKASWEELAGFRRVSGWRRGEDYCTESAATGFLRAAGAHGRDIGRARY